jgi:hypothetical protein
MGELKDRVEKIFEAFNESWMNYWNTYVDLQNQLYESARAARQVSWLAATDVTKLSDINRAQRELFASMPRRVDYEPLGQITRSLDTAASVLDNLSASLEREQEKCRRLEEAIATLIEQTRRTKEELRTSES